MEHQARQKYSKIKCCLYHCRMYMTGLKLLLYNRLYGEVNTGWKHIRSRFSWPYIPCVARNFCRRLFLRIGDFFVLRELIFATRTDWSTQYPALTIFSFLLSTSRAIIWLLSTCNRNAYFKTILRCASVFLCIPLCFWTKKTSCKRRYVFYWGWGGGGRWAAASEGRVLSTFLTNWGVTNPFLFSTGGGSQFFWPGKNYSMSLLFCIYKQSYQSRLI